MSGGDSELRDRIRILTAALEGIRSRDSQVSQRNVSSNTRTFVHLAQLLNGSPPDDIAITGSFGFLDSEAVLVASNSKDDPEAVDEDRDNYSVVSLRPRPVPQIEWATGKIPNPEGVDTKTLAETLLWTWQQLSSLSREQDRPQFLKHACRWFLRAGWRRYCSRLLLTMRLEWSPLPYKTMKAWRPELEDDQILRGYEGNELRAPSTQEPHFKSFPREVKGQYVLVTFRVKDAAAWVHLLSDLLRSCCDATKNPPPADGQPPGFQLSASFLPIISILLDFPPIKALLTQTSLGKAFLRKCKLDAEAHDESALSGDMDSESESTPNVEDQLTGVAAESLGEIVDEDVNETDRDSAYTVHRGGLLVFRYLKTLVAPMRALLHLSRRTKPGDGQCSSSTMRDVSVKLVTLAPPRRADRNIREDVLDRVRNELKQKVKSKLGNPLDADLTLVTANRWIDRYFTKESATPAMTESETPATMGSATPATKDFVGPTTSTSRVRKPHLSSFTGNVHAEAGLMALSYSEPGIIMHPGQQSLPIGVSKKCCWTCRKLSLLLQSGDTPHKFDLPGCHGTIHAWSPPEFGIPMAVLKSLCDALYDKAVEAAIENAEDRKSQVSSPASEPGMLPELVIAEEYLPIP